MLALVRCGRVENLDAIECGVVGVFIAPTTEMVVGRLLSHGAPDSSVRHWTLSGAPATSASRWRSTVGALTCGASGLSGGAPDRPCRLSGVPPARALLLCACRRAFNARSARADVRRAHSGTPDKEQLMSGVHRTSRRAHKSEAPTVRIQRQ